MKNSSKNTWGTVLLVVTLGAGYLWLGYLPNQRSIREFADELRQQQETTARAAAVSTALDAAQARLHAAATYNAGRAALLPPETQVAAVLGRIDTLTAAAGCTPTRFDPEPAVRMARLCRVPVIVGCAGTFAQIAKFLYDIESLPQTMWTDQLHITTGRKNGGDVECELIVTIFTDNSGDSDQVRLVGQPIDMETNF